MLSDSPNLKGNPPCSISELTNFPVVRCLTGQRLYGGSVWKLFLGQKQIVHPKLTVSWCGIDLLIWLWTKEQSSQSGDLWEPLPSWETFKTDSRQSVSSELSSQSLSPSQRQSLRAQRPFLHLNSLGSQGDGVPGRRQEDAQNLCRCL